MRKTLISGLAALSVGGLLIGGAFAHTGATGIVKERMMLMETLGDSMKELTAMMRGKADYDAARVREIATKMRDHGGDAMIKLFPEGSLDKPSEALPTIWQDWERFEQIAETMATYAGALAAAADNDQTMPGPGMMGQRYGQGMPGPGMMGQGYGQGTPGQGMMGQGRRGGGTPGQGMMGQGMMGEMVGPDPEHLATMPPQAVFRHLAATCAACHEDFRKPQ